MLIILFDNKFLSDEAKVLLHRDEISLGLKFLHYVALMKDQGNFFNRINYRDVSLESHAS